MARPCTRDTSYPGEHAAIIDREIWDKVHAILTESPRKRAASTRAETPALLKGLLYGPDGAAFSPTHTRKGGRLYRYYVSQTVLKHGAGACPVGRVPAGEIEAAVIDQMRAVFRQPEMLAATGSAAQLDRGSTQTKMSARRCSSSIRCGTNSSPPNRHASSTLIERVEIGTDGLKLRFRDKGLSHMATEVGGMADKNRRSAA